MFDIHFHSFRNAFFLRNGHQAILTREPGGTKVAEDIRNILIKDYKQPLDGKMELLLNFAARSHHIENLIKPAIDENKIVICDRFFDSTLAYQGYGYGVDLKIIKQIQQFTIGNFTPDITFFIDISLDNMQQRIKGRADNNKYENMQMSFHKKVQDGLY